MPKPESKLLDALLPRTRQAILATVLLSPDRWWYASELARQVGATPSTLQRELCSLTEAGILRRRVEGRQVYYQADPECPVLSELQGLVLKTAGLIGVLKKALAPFRKSIEVAFVYGSIARGEELSASDVDLMVVGEVGLADIATRLRKAQNRLARPVNPTIYGADEFRRKVADEHHFLRSVLDSDKLFVIGTHRELETTLEGESSRAKVDKQARGERTASGRRAKSR